VLRAGSPQHVPDEGLNPMKNNNTALPLARTADLVINELPDEVLVYDLKTHQAHCLNNTAALIWRHCDGQRTVAEITQAIEVAERTLFDESAVWAALEQLNKSGLLVNKVVRPAEVPAFSRRRAMRKIGVGAAATLPLVMTIIAPSAAEAATCNSSANRDNQCPCDMNNQCMSGCCSDTGMSAGTTEVCVANGIRGVGATCSMNCACASNMCGNDGMCR
jgi:hypothetical protein